MISRYSDRCIATAGRLSHSSKKEGTKQSFGSKGEKKGGEVEEQVGK